MSRASGSLTPPLPRPLPPGVGGPAPAVPQAPSLPYAPPLPQRRRRWVRRLMGVGLLIAVASTGPLWFPPVSGRLQTLYWQQQCLSHCTPPSTVVNERLAGNTRRPAVKIVPAHWEKLYDQVSPPGLLSEGTVFLGELRSRSGARRLVAVDVPRPVIDHPSGERDFVTLYYH